MEDNMKKLRAGVVGLGMGRCHIDSYIENNSVELAAIADINEERLKEISAEKGIKDIYADPLEMFEKAGLDAVSIAVPNKFHAPLSIAALKKGIHVLCEKPMAMNLEEAMQMKKAAEESGCNLMINFSYRFNPLCRALKQEVDKGTFGNIYFGRTTWHRRRGMPGFGGWFGDKDMAGGGPLIDLGVHRIDLALWLMGHPEPVSVCGSTYNVIAKKIAEEQQKKFTVEDLAVGIVKFDNGATLVVEASWALNNNKNEDMITSLYGDKGGLVQKNVGQGYDQTAEIYTDEDGMLVTRKPEIPSEGVPASYEEFVSSVLEKRSPSASAEDGIKVQKILDGLYRRAQEGIEIRFKT